MDVTLKTAVSRTATVALAAVLAAPLSLPVTSAYAESAAPAPAVGVSTQALAPGKPATTGTYTNANIKMTDYKATGKWSDGRFYPTGNTKDKYLKNAWARIKSKIYYFGKNGKPVSGIKKVSGKTWYFNWSYKDTRYGMLMQSAWTYYDPTSSWYCSSKDGSMKPGWQSAKTSNGKTYKFYTDLDGRVKTGHQKIGGKVYRFSAPTGVLQNSSYVGNFGALVDKYTGQKYYLYKDGYVAANTIFKNKNGVLSWADSNGFAVIGTSEGSLRKLGGEYRLVDDLGRLWKGWKKYGDKKYRYFDKQTGAMYRSRTVTIDGYTCEFNSNGWMTSRKKN